MASFLDILPNFQPYVQQLPVDAMVQVGMQKQAQYNAGIQKIQGEIDKVAGLDIYKDVDKNYLQSKLNELGDKMTFFAAGDFSDFQLTNSVAGMANQLTKDPIVQNAVNSTSWYKKQISAIQKARQEGKSDIANEDLFTTQANMWINDGQVGSSFSAEYVPYTDVFKKLQEIAKSIGEDSTIVQQLFQTDGNGNPVLVNGKLQYNDVMAETLLKGKDKNKILDAFQNGLNSNDYRQLGITGRYQLKGKSKEELDNILEVDFSEYQQNQLIKKDLIQDRILELKNKNGSQEEIDALQKTIVSIDDRLSKRRQSVDQLKSQDADYVRGQIYTNNFLDSLSTDFSTKETYTKYLKNPAVEIMLDKERLKLSTNEYLLRREEFGYKKQHDREKMSFEKWKALFEKGLVDENGNPTGAGLYSGPYRDLPVNEQDNPTYFTDQFEKGLTEDMDAQYKLYEKVAIADWLAKNSGKMNPKTNKPFTSDEMKNEINNWAKKLGLSYNDYIILQGQKATDRYNSSDGGYLGLEYVNDFKNINVLSKRIGINAKKKELEKEYIKNNATSFTPVDLSKVNLNPVTITAVIGGDDEGKGAMRRQNVTLNKQDVMDFAKFIYHDTEGILPGVLDSDLVKKQAEEAKQRLVKKYGVAGFESMKNGLMGSNFNFNPFEQIFSGPYEEQNSEIKKAIDILKNDNYKKTMSLREQYYKGTAQISVPKAVVLYKDKPEQEKHLSATLASIASDYTGIDDDYSEIAKAAADPKSQFQINITPAASNYGKNTYELQMTDKDGNVKIKPITEQQYVDLAPNKTIPSTNVSLISSVVELSPYNSTNLVYSPTDNDAYSTAFIKKEDTKAKQYNVAIDYVRGGNNLYFPKLYIKMENDRWKMIPYNSPLTEQEASNFAQGVDDIFIKSLLSKKK